MSRSGWMLIEPAIKNRICAQCGNTITQGTHCLVVAVKAKRMSFCADCILIMSSKLLQHHNVQEIKERVVEQLI